MNKVLITGITGMLGQDLVSELKKDYNLFGLSRQEKVSIVGAEVLRGDITVPEDLDRIFKDVKPSLIIHSAAYTDVDGCEDDSDWAYLVNTMGSISIYIRAREQNIPVIYISTDYVFNGMKGEAYGVEDKPCPINVYGESKLCGERFGRMMLRNFIVVRTSALFGKNGKNFVDTVLKKGKSGEKLKVLTNYYTSPTYTKDLAVAIKNIIKEVKSGKEIYHVCNEGICNWYGFAGEILKEKSVLEPITDERELNRSAKRPKFSVLKSSVKMRAWQEALKEYIDEKKSK